MEICCCCCCWLRHSTPSASRIFFDSARFHDDVAGQLLRGEIKLLRKHCSRYMRNKCVYESINTHRCACTIICPDIRSRIADTHFPRFHRRRCRQQQQPPPAITTTCAHAQRSTHVCILMYVHMYSCNSNFLTDVRPPAAKAVN